MIIEPNRSRQIHGFTLLELMVTLAIVVTVLGMAIPSFTDEIQTNRQTTLINELTSFIYLTKNTAVTQGVDVSICKSNSTGTACDSTADWQDGWLVFTDKNSNGVINDDGDSIYCETSDDDCVIKVHGALQQGAEIKSDVTHITFGSRGFTGSTAVFTYCDDRGASYTRSKTLSKTGRLKDTSTHLSCS